ncbi:histidine kinase [Actinoplanes sp. NPDC049802]|uniref:sensor histidine kinase n=1 Tax=Actinoplanes sp. NPDC049802 TaxID=3154742 RepID=UPI0033C4E38A
MREKWLDGILVAALTIAAITLTGDVPDGPAQMRFDVPGGGFFPTPEPETPPVLNLLITLPLLLRRRWPVACFAVQFASLISIDIEGNVANLAAVLIGAYAVALHGRSVPLSMGVLLSAGVATAATRDQTWPRVPGWAGVFVILVPIGLLGVAVRAARSRALASEQRAEALVREQRTATRLAVADERARIARELHDVVSHHVSVMTIQAGAAGKVLDRDPELARGALAAIENGGRETMAELRHLLGVLNPDAGLLEPQPGLESLESLVGGVRNAGQPVTLTCTVGALPHGLGLTVYRVVQEALTNAMRHAPGAATTVTLSSGNATLFVEVVNAPGKHSGEPGGGTGLLGLAERLRVYDGTLETGECPDGGFRVAARIPLAQSMAS